MQERLEGISFNSIYCFFFFSLLYFLYGDDVNARCILYSASINELPAPDSVLVCLLRLVTKYFIIIIIIIIIIISLITLFVA